MRRRETKNNFASDPYMLKPDQAQAQLEKEMKVWGKYMKIAKIEQQG